MGAGQADKINSRAIQRRGPGRPRFEHQETADEPSDEELRRKTRLKLSQRAYRSRKEHRLSAAIERSERLKSALEQAAASFKQFRDVAHELGQEALHPKLAAQLSKTATEIESLSKDVLQDTDPSPPSRQPETQCISSDLSNNNSNFVSLPRPFLDIGDPLVTIASSPKLARQTATNDADFFELRNSTPKSLVLSTLTASRASQLPLGMQFIRACMRRTFAILSTEFITLESLRHYFALPLSIVSRTNLKIMALELSTGDENGTYIIPPPSPSEIKILPNLYRVVEGCTKSWILPRMAPPFLQCLEYGRTRTVLQTDTLELQGEWLEAADVQEYLEERGIQVRELHQVDHSIATASIEGMTPTAYSRGDRSLAASTNLLLDAPIISRQHESVSRTPVINNVGSDWSIFGCEGESSLPVPSGYTDIVTMRHRLPDVDGIETPQARRLVINLDKLVENLAAQAVCLGSVPGIRKSAVDEAIRVSITS